MERIKKQIDREENSHTRVKSHEKVKPASKLLLPQKPCQRLWIPCNKLQYYQTKI